MGRNTRELILSTAFSCITRDGTVSVNAVIAEAGLSKGVFFHHFRSKQDLLLEIADRDFREQIARMESFAQALPDAPGKMLKAYVMAWVEDVTLTGQKQLNALNMLNELLLRERLADQRRRLFDTLRDPTVPEAVMLVVLNACVGAWAQNLVGNETREEIIALRKTMARELFRIIDHAVLCSDPEPLHAGRHE